MIAPPIDPATGAPRKRNPWVMALLTGVVLVFLAFWIYVFLFADTTSPNQVPDRTWAKRTAATCAATAEQLAALPSARTFADITPKAEALRQRADVGEQATALVVAMVAQIRSQPPSDAVSQGAVTNWLADYDTYVADRNAHVAKLARRARSALRRDGRGRHPEQPRHGRLRLGQRHAPLPGAPGLRLTPRTPGELSHPG